MHIDFRVRINSPEYMALFSGPEHDWKWRRWGYPELREPGSEAEFLRQFDACGAKAGVYTGRQIVDAKGHVTRGLTNEYVADCVDRSQGRLIGFAGVDMTAGKLAVQELKRCVAEYGFRGVSLDPHWSHVHADDKKAYPIYECAGELGIPVVFTVGPIAGDYGNPAHFYQPASDFPNVSFVCSHGVWPQVLDFLALAYRHENIYLEPTIYWALPGTQPMFEAANGFLVDQVIYASAFPFNPLNIIEKFRSRIEWSDEAWRKVTYENAAKLLKIDQ